MVHVTFSLALSLTKWSISFAFRQTGIHYPASTAAVKDTVNPAYTLIHCDTTPSAG